MNEKIYWLGFSLFPGIGPRKFQKLLETFGSAEIAWKADISDLQHVLGNPLSGKLDGFRKKISLQEYAEKCAEKNIQLVTYLDKQYPQLLRQNSSAHSYYPPFLLYVKGTIEVLNTSKPIAVVGTRKMTQYGREVTKMITAELVENGCTIVSGLALGVDGVAHETALNNNGKTIAVLGCGVDCCTPRTNQGIYNRILDSGGTIISTFPPGMEATVGSFPARNSIIAGISLGVVVTEGAEDSGALITAQKAKQCNRQVFAVPGPITSQYSKGSNNLLRHGGISVTDARDILKTLGYNSSKIPKQRKHNETISYTKDEQEILYLLQNNSLHFDEIVRRIGKDAKNVGSILSMMEIKGMIKNNGGIYRL